MSEKLSFSLLQLIEETINSLERYKELTTITFQKLENNFYICYEGTFYEVTVDKNSDYIWMIFDYGKPMPKDKNLTNINTGDKIPNKREDDEVELTSQLFVLYHYKSKTLYTSNINKIKFIEDILSKKLEKRFIVKKYFKTIEEFIETLKCVTEISFTDTSNLFNDNEERQALKDLTGTDAPEKFKITANYPIGVEFKQFIRKITGKVGSNTSSLVIKGIDESNFNFVYNQQNFVKKIEVRCFRDSLGKFVPKEVLNELLKNI